MSCYLTHNTTSVGQVIRKSFASINKVHSGDQVLQFCWMKFCILYTFFNICIFCVFYKTDVASGRLGKQAKSVNVYEHSKNQWSWHKTAIFHELVLASKRCETDGLVNSMYKNHIFSIKPALSAAFLGWRMIDMDKWANFSGNDATKVNKTYLMDWLVTCNIILV